VKEFSMRAIPIAIMALAISTGFAGADPDSTAIDVLRARQDLIADAQERLDAAPNSQARKDALAEAVRATFDFERLAHESIARHWEAMTPAQQEDYLRLFVDLVEKSTINMLETYRAAGTEYVEEQQDGDEAVVTTIVISTGGDEVAIQYNVYLSEGRWWIWDRTIGLDTDITEYDVSSAENYRSSFNRIIRDDGVDELLRRLRAKSSGDDDI